MQPTAHPPNGRGLGRQVDLSLRNMDPGKGYEVFPAKLSTCFFLFLYLRIFPKYFFLTLLFFFFKFSEIPQNAILPPLPRSHHQGL